MKIQSKELDAVQALRASTALGRHLGLLDNQRNTRAATADEVREFCFGPLRRIVMVHEDAVARAAVVVPDIPPFDLA